MKSIVVKLCKRLLALLGFAVVSCDILEIRCEYGTPTMDYTVMGKVVNRQGENLKGIKVKSMEYMPDSTYTDAYGSFRIVENDVTGGGGKVPLVFEDETEIYRSDTVYVQLTQVEEGDGDWYCGAYEAKDVKITMKEK